MNPPVHSSVHSFIYVQQPARLLVIVSDRQMTSVCPRAAPGMRHLSVFTQNKGGLWWYHLGVAAPPHCHCHTTGDFHFPVIEFLSRLFVFRWRSDEVPPLHNTSSPTSLRIENQPPKRVCVYLFPTSLHIMNIYYKLSGEIAALVKAFFQ